MIEVVVEFFKVVVRIVVLLVVVIFEVVDVVTLNEQGRGDGMR